jgi:hypothetical protein
VAPTSSLVAGHETYRLYLDPEANLHDRAEKLFQTVIDGWRSKDSIYPQNYPTCVQYGYASYDAMQAGFVLQTPLLDELGRKVLPVSRYTYSVRWPVTEIGSNRLFVNFYPASKGKSGKSVPGDDDVEEAREHTATIQLSQSDQDQRFYVAV